MQEIDDAAPLDKTSMEALQGVAALTRMANDASVVGLSLLAATKKDIQPGRDTPPEPDWASQIGGAAAQTDEDAGSGR